MTSSQAPGTVPAPVILPRRAVPISYEADVVVVGAGPGGFAAALQAARMGVPNVIDVRNIGLVAGIELAPKAGAPAARAYEIFVKAFEKGILIRTTGDTIALSPPLIVEPAHIDQLVTTLGQLIKESG